MRTSSVKLLLVAVVAMVLSLVSRADAAGVGTFTLKSKEAQEVSGAWHIYAKIELPKAPLTAHQTMRFILTKTVAYERSLVDGRSEPVLNRQALTGQTPSTEILDVGFSDASGKIFKGTSFDFGLTRTRGYEAGEYSVELRASDNTIIGGKQTLTLKGDNPVVDRRAMAFNAKDSKVKKIEGYDAGANQADNELPANNNASGAPGEVTPMGTATGFVPKEGLQETEEEKIKTKPGGCNCDQVGTLGAGTLGAQGGTRSPASALVFLLPILGIGIAAYRRRSRRPA